MVVLDREIVVSVYSTVRARDADGYPYNHVVIPLSDVLEKIRIGSDGLDGWTHMCQVLNVTDRTAYKEYKASRMPAFQPAGMFKQVGKGTRGVNQPLVKHSQLLQFDFDCGSEDEAHNLKSNLIWDPYVVYLFLSPSGCGVKGALIASADQPLTELKHRLAFTGLEDYMSQYGKIDENCKDVTRMCFLAHDPLVYFNHYPEPFEWEDYAEEWSFNTVPETESRKVFEGEVDLAALDYIPADEYEMWINVGIACKNHGLDVSVWDKWSKRSAKYEPGECEKKWATFNTDEYQNREIGWGSIVYLARQSGYEPKRKRSAHIRLSKTEHNPESETLKAIWDRLYYGILEWEQRTYQTKEQHLLVLGTGAGTGKSTAANRYLEQFADISPTRELADEKYEAALAAEKNAMRHRSRNYNREASDNYTPETAPIGLDASKGEVPCAYPDNCNALAESDYNPTSTFCGSCSRFDECGSKGYLSQWKLMPKYDAIFFSYQDDFFSDPRYRDHIDTVIKAKKEDFVLVLDEVDPADLPPKRGYRTEHLKQIASDFRDFTAGVFLKMLIEKTSPAIEPMEWATAVKEVLAEFPSTDLDTIDNQLQNIPVHISFEKSESTQCTLMDNPIYRTLAHITYHNMTRTCAVLTEESDPTVYEKVNQAGLNGWVENYILPEDGWVEGKRYPDLLNIDDFCRIGFGSMRSPESIGRLPHRLINFTADLREFIESVKSETPACHEVHEGKNHVGWTYYLRPSINAHRGIIISASEVLDIIKELYAHTEIVIESIEGKPAEWKQGCKIFQISTGRYSPAGSFIRTDKAQNYKAVGLHERGQELLELITTEVKNGKETLIVGPKDFTTEGDLTHLPEVSSLLALPNAYVINHHHAEGVNQYEHCENAFIFLYEPRPDELQKIASRIYRNQTLSFEREKKTLEKWGVILQDVQRYKDPRVQAVFDKECEKRLMQSITRLRQMIYEDKRVYLLTSEPVSYLPVSPLICTIPDLKACQAQYGTLDMLETFLEKKASRTVKEIAEQDKVSERTARRRTQEQRTSERNKLVKHAQELKAKGMSYKEIETELNITRGKLQGLLKHKVY